MGIVNHSWAINKRNTKIECIKCGVEQWKNKDSVCVYDPSQKSGNDTVFEGLDPQYDHLSSREDMGIFEGYGECEKKEDNEGMEYLAMYIPTKEVVKRRLPISLEVMYTKNTTNYLNSKLAEWNRISPGVWQYYTA